MATELDDRVRARIRQVRFERGLTVGAVARAAGIATSTVSRLETGARRLTLAHVDQLAPALGVTTNHLLGTDTPSDPPESRDGRVWTPVGPERTTGRRVYRVTIPVGADEPRPHSHEGYQWFYVLSGSVRLIVDDREVVLDEGQAAEFHTWRPHSLSAVDDPAEALVIFAPDGEPLDTIAPAPRSV